MTGDERTAVYRAALEAVRDGDRDALARHFAEDVVDHNPLPGQPAGLAGFVFFMEYMHRGLADLRLSFDAVIAEGDLVAARTRWTGRHVGPFLGVERATGREVEIATLHMVRVTGGQVAEMWGLADVHGAQAQLAGEA